MLTEPFAVLLSLPTRSYSQPSLSSAEFTSFFSTLQDVNKRIKTETSILTWQKCIYFTANKIDWSCKLNTTKFKRYSNYWQIWYVDIVTQHTLNTYISLYRDQQPLTIIQYNRDWCRMKKPTCLIKKIFFLILFIWFCNIYNIERQKIQHSHLHSCKLEKKIN